MLWMRRPLQSGPRRSPSRGSSAIPAFFGHADVHRELRPGMRAFLSSGAGFKTGDLPERRRRGMSGTRPEISVAGPRMLNRCHRPEESRRSEFGEAAGWPLHPAVAVLEPLPAADRLAHQQPPPKRRGSGGKRPRNAAHEAATCPLVEPSTSDSRMRPASRLGTTRLPENPTRSRRAPRAPARIARPPPRRERRRKAARPNSCPLLHPKRPRSARRRPPARVNAVIAPCAGRGGRRSRTRRGSAHRDRARRRSCRTRPGRRLSSGSNGPSATSPRSPRCPSTRSLRALPASAP
jgi:hypothetical protein